MAVLHVDAPPHALSDLPARARDAARWAPDVSLVVALAWWATFLTRGVGGRESTRLSVGLLLAAVAFVLVRPWERMARAESVLCAALGLAPFVVCLTAPTGWEGAHVAASYLYAVLVYGVLRGWAVDPGRRVVALGVVVAAAGVEFSSGWLAWWGGQDPRAFFQGTFYWYNQTAIFMVGGAVAGAVCAAVLQGPARTLSCFVVPLAVAGTLFTTSRGAEIGLVLGMVLAAGVSSRFQPRWRGPLTVGALGAGGVGLAFLISRPPFFPFAVSPFSSTAARSATFKGNGVQRIEDWRRGWEIFKHWPVSGAGFNSYNSATTLVTTRHDTVKSSFAHNGIIQAMSDGGVVLAVPVVLATVALVVVMLRRVLARRPEPVALAATCALVVLLLHSGMDFDWSYPALLAMTAVLAALVPQPRAERAPTSGRALVLAGTVGLVLAAAWSARHGGLDLNATVPHA